jgi:integral membrane protein
MGTPQKRFVLLRLLDKIEATRPFTENEAWLLFRVVAFAEAFGWTVLIIGIAMQRYDLPGGKYSVPVAGQIHGTIFLAYFGILLATYSSQRWSRWKFLAGVAAGIPPYGSLVFELYSAHARRHKLVRQHFRSILLARLLSMAE